MKFERFDGQSRPPIIRTDVDGDGRSSWPQNVALKSDAAPNDSRFFLSYKCHASPRPRGYFSGALAGRM